MTENEWLESNELRSMLEFLRNKVSDRKLRLFAIACCHRIDHLLVDERSRKALAAAERYADGELCGRDELYSYSCIAGEASAATLTTVTNEDGIEFDNPFCAAACAVEDAANPDIDLTGQGSLRPLAVRGAAFHARDAVGLVVFSSTFSEEDADVAVKVENVAQVILLRCIFGNPFQPVTVQPSFLTWNEGTVSRIAQAIYDDRAFNRLPILADALEDAGCDNADILNHCRSGGEHVRGCWVIDLLLGKS